MDDNTSRIFSDNLKKYMNLFNLNQADVANLCGVTQQSVSLWLNGERLPRMGKVQKLADYFGILKSELLEEEDSRELYKVKRLQTLYLVANNMEDDDFNELINFAKYLNSKRKK